MICVLVPTEAEAAPLRRVLPMPDGPVRLEVCGAGMAACAATTARLALLAPERMLLCGIAGAYPASGLPVGEVVSVRRERIADLGAWRGERMEPLFGRDYPATWALPGWPEADGCTVDCAASPLVRDSGEGIENMEGAAFMAVCNALGIPCAELRAVSNRVGDPAALWRAGEALEALSRALNTLLGR